MELADVRKLARLSRIDIPEEELAPLLADMQSILGYVGEIESITISADTHVPAVRNVMREDASPHESGAYTEVLIAEAPAAEAGFVKVAQIFSDDE